MASSRPLSLFSSDPTIGNEACLLAAGEIRHPFPRDPSHFKQAGRSVGRSEQVSPRNGVPLGLALAPWSRCCGLSAHSQLALLSPPFPAHSGRSWQARVHSQAGWHAEAV